MGTPIRATIAAGLVLAAAARMIASDLYAASATDPAVFRAATLLVLATALAAAWIPARRAARVDPVAARGRVMDRQTTVPAGTSAPFGTMTIPSRM